MNFPQHGLTSARLLTLLNKYMIEYIDAWPNKIKPFENWIDQYIEKKKVEGNKKQIQQFKARCRYCDRKFDDVVAKTKDHVIPTSKFGLNVKENRVLACSDCNGWKDSKTLEEWYKELKKVVKKEKIRPPYTKNLIGLMMSRVQYQINEMKNKKSKVSIYKI